jgi:hypothetical protein
VGVKRREGENSITHHESCKRILGFEGNEAYISSPTSGIYTGRKEEISTHPNIEICEYK